MEEDAGGTMHRHADQAGTRWTRARLLARPPWCSARCCLLGPIASLAAQVGHRPESSPYHDIPKGHTVTAIFGQFGGGGGQFEIAPHDGQVYGLRYDIRTGSPVQLGLGVRTAP